MSYGSRKRATTVHIPQHHLCLHTDMYFSVRIGSTRIRFGEVALRTALTLYVLQTDVCAPEETFDPVLRLLVVALPSVRSSVCVHVCVCARVASATGLSR